MKLDTAGQVIINVDLDDVVMSLFMAIISEMRYS